MRAAVIGLGFGDEGKGMVVSYLSSILKKPLVVRYSGGHQAGHAVVDERNRKHSFVNFGSGTLQGCPTYWSKHCTFEPVGFLNELADLVDLMKEDFDGIKVYLHEDCPVTTPYDINFNQKAEVEKMHGTCGVGFGETLERESNHFHLRVSDLFNPSVLVIKLEQVAKYYGLFYKSPVDTTDFLEAVSVLNSESKFPNEVITVVGDTDVPSYPNTIYEGSQGLLLDQDIGFFPHVTRSNVGRKRLDNFIYHYDEVWYVTRAYQTRHGAGPMTNEDEPFTLINLETETNEENKWQGPFRRSILDLDLLKYAIKHDRKNIRRVQEERLVITCLDQMVQWIYKEDGDLHTCENETDFVANVAKSLGFSENIYLSRSPKNELEKWKGGNYDDKEKV